MLSIRDGRAVIPVAAANKRKLQGFIHDESATGKTFYVEPVEVVEINNELKEPGVRRAARDRADPLGLHRLDSPRSGSDRADWRLSFGSGYDPCQSPLGRCQRSGEADRFDGRPAGAAQCAASLVAADAPGAGQAGGAARSATRQTASYPGDFGAECRRQVGVSENYGHHQYMFQCGFLVPASENSGCPCSAT